MQPDDLENDELIKIGVAANLSQSYASDQRAFIDYFASLMERVLPGETEIERRGSLFAPKKAWKVKVSFGEHFYTLEAPKHGPLQATRTKVVRGIALKTEPLPVEEWLRKVGEQTSEYARTHREASEALKAHLNLGV